MPESTSAGQKGQSFEVFRVLIAAAIALAVLTIILATITSFDVIRENASFDVLSVKWKSAVDSPNNQVFSTNSLFFRSGTRFSKLQFSRQVNLPSYCIAFKANVAQGYASSGAAVEVVSSSPGDIFLQCNVNNTVEALGGEGCFAYCKISFGEEP